MAPSLLLDTHALLWWLAEPEKLSMPAQAAIGDPADKVFVSAASGWELATKARLGKLPGAEGLLQDLPSLLQTRVFNRWPCSCIMASTPVATRRPTGIPSIGFWRPKRNWRACNW
jgi:PIN domain nuclease of toxin-antitoxin system